MLYFLFLFLLIFIFIIILSVFAVGLFLIPKDEPDGADKQEKALNIFNEYFEPGKQRPN